MLHKSTRGYCRRHRPQSLLSASALVLLLTVLKPPLLAQNDMAELDRDARSELLRETRSRDPEISATARARLAADYRVNNDLDRALKLVDDAGKFDEANLRWPRILLFTEHARIKAAAGQLAEAIAALHYSERRTEGLPAVLTAEAMADILSSQVEQLEKAKTYYEQALTQGNTYFHRQRLSEATLAPAKPLDAQWQSVRRRLTAKLAKLARDLLVSQYGLDYVLYKEAGELRVAGKLDSAATHYRQLLALSADSIYGAAAGYYLGQCITGANAVREKLNYYADFYKAAPTAPYRGEALYAMASLHLTSRWNIRDATDFFQRTIDWCQQARNEQQALTLYTVPAKSRAIAAPPAEPAVIDGWGIIHEVAVPPDKLLNRYTASWYLNQLETRARYGLVFCLIAAEKWTEARSELDVVLDLHPQMREQHGKGIFTTYFRLKKVCELGHLVVDPCQLQGLAPNEQLRIQYGDFLFIQEQLDAALAFHRETITQASERSRNQIAALALTTIANITQYQGNPEKATAILHQVIADYGNLPASAHAHIYVANNIFSHSGPLADPKTVVAYDKALELYKKAERLAPGSLHCMSAGVGKMRCFVFMERHEEAEKQKQELLRRWPQHSAYFNNNFRMYNKIHAEFKKMREDARQNAK